MILFGVALLLIIPGVAIGLAIKAHRKPIPKGCDRRFVRLGPSAPAFSANTIATAAKLGQDLTVVDPDSEPEVEPGLKDATIAAA